MASETLAARQALWQRRLENWQQSPLSTAEWCRQQQLPEHQFFYWKRKLISGAESKLIPVVVNQQSENASGKVVIHLSSGLRVETETTDVVAFIRKLEAL